MRIIRLISQRVLLLPSSSQTLLRWCRELLCDRYVVLVLQHYGSTKLDYNDVRGLATV